MNSDVFEVTCGLGGTFLPPPIHLEKVKRNYLNGWPLCDTTTPSKCSDYPDPPDIVELLPAEPQYPGTNHTSFYIKKKKIE